MTRGDAERFIRGGRSNPATPAASRTPRAPQPPTSLAAPPATRRPASSPPSTTNRIVAAEPKSVWHDYRSKIIRRVFDGDFGRGLRFLHPIPYAVSTPMARSISKNCHAYLPARHEAVNDLSGYKREEKVRYGNVVSQQQDQSWTVDVDSRFAPTYR